MLELKEQLPHAVPVVDHLPEANVIKRSRLEASFDAAIPFRDGFAGHDDGVLPGFDDWCAGFPVGVGVLGDGTRLEEHRMSIELDHGFTLARV